LARRGDELEDLGRAFNGLLSRLQESFERQQRFTGDASHQLRTPLAILLGQVEVALRRERSAGEYRGVLGNVQAQAVRLHQIVEALLFLARADAEVEAPQLETVELRGWLQSHLRTWSDHPRFQDLRWEAGPEESLLIETHPPLLGELLDNLWDNACKYSDPGTPLSLGVQAASDACFISVKDAGCGITPEDLPHLFEPFYQSRAARQHGRAGVGLGLAVADRIARALGGGLQVTSTAGQGARFTLQLRRHPPQE
jgi:signal transduction histidine kinase